MSKLQGQLKSSSGKIMDVQFPIARSDFEDLIRELTIDDPDGTWGFCGFLVCAAPEGRSLEKCKSLSEINYYGHIVSQFTDDDWVVYQFLLDAGVAEWETLGNLINIAANVDNFCTIENISSYKDLGAYLTKDDPNYSDADDKTLRDIGKQYVKDSHGKISQGYFIQRCKKSYKDVYDRNPRSIPEQFQLDPY